MANIFEEFETIAYELIKSNPTISFRTWRNILRTKYQPLIAKVCGSCPHEQNEVLFSWWNSREYTLMETRISQN